jgi:hypothetical protein
MIEKTVAADGGTTFEKVWLPELGVMISRETNLSDKGMYLAFKGGHNDENHNHNDIGNIVVYYNGRPVFIDAGSGEYTKLTFSDKRYTLWNTQSGYHNTVTVNGIAQLPGEQYKATCYDYDEATGGLSFELKEAYPPEAKIKSLVRSAVLKDGRAEIKDKVELDGVGEIDIHFLTHIKPEIQGDKITLAEGRVLTYDPALTPCIETLEVDSVFESRWKSKELYAIRLKATASCAEYVNYIE